jgi:hypothetical protein
MAEGPAIRIGCQAVIDHISKPIPEKLWHYTSYAAFQAIVSSKKIWATEYRFLNDREEFRHAKNLALELVEEELEFVGAQFPARDTLRNSVNVAFNTGALHGDRHRIMVASFSEAEDQLSQWRGYPRDSATRFHHSGVLFEPPERRIPSILRSLEGFPLSQFALRVDSHAGRNMAAK